MDILLIRHGSTEHSSANGYNEQKRCPDPALNESGLIQAELLGERIKNYGIQKIYSSDLERAMQTAAIINKYIGKDIEIREELREINMGRLHLSTWEEIRKEDPQYYEEWNKRLKDLPYPDGECGEDVKKRCLTVIEEIISSDYESIAMVLHGGTIRTLLCAFLGIGQEKRFYFGLPPENCSISVVKYNRESKEFHIHSFNDAAHLENKQLIKSKA